MLYLHQYPAIWDLPSLSPFCIKVETYLRMVNLPFEIVIENNPRKGPKGKFPVLRDNDTVVADSSFIIHYLKNQYGDVLDHNLTPKEIALAHTMQRTIEESLYFAILYSRWIDPAGTQIIDESFQTFFPKPLAKLALAYIRRNLKKQAFAQGIGRHHKNEVYEIGCKDIETISLLLGNQSYFFGDKPHAIDATIYAFLITILFTPLKNPLQNRILSLQNLMDYVLGMKTVLCRHAFSWM